MKMKLICNKGCNKEEGMEIKQRKIEESGVTGVMEIYIECPCGYQYHGHYYNEESLRLQKEINELIELCRKTSENWKREKILKQIKVSRTKKRKILEGLQKSMKKAKKE